MLERLETLPTDPLFQLVKAFQQDPNPEKMNLGIGVYTTETGEPYVMPAVRLAASGLTSNNYNYTPLGGDPMFLRNAGKLVLGGEFDLDGFAMQAVCGGTHACAVFALLAARAGYKHILVAEPTWVNHRNIFSAFSQTIFSHLNMEGKVSLEDYRKAIETVSEPTILLIHGGLTHNPTGINFSLEQLRVLADVIRSRPIFVFIDFAYLGLGEGIEQDTEFVRLLMRELQDVAVGISFSKNATLYAHRTGALLVKTKQKERVESNLRQIVRSSISSAPVFGQRILNTIFEQHFSLWQQNIDEMRQSIDSRRKALISAAPELRLLDSTRGLFGLLPITAEQVNQLQTEYSVYLPKDGRINFSGIETRRITYLTEALHSLWNPT